MSWNVPAGPVIFQNDRYSRGTKSVTPDFCRVTRLSLEHYKSLAMSDPSRGFRPPELTSALQLLCLAQRCSPRMPSGGLQSSSKSCGSGLCFPVTGLGALKSCDLGQACTPLCGGSTSSGSLGVLPGATVGCVTQLPSSHVVIQPTPLW
ncbi:hypothetical protein lerEdw1_010664 [Lerista edwardsae]|nr:hypothetical protein lerEdw1_010664 [Lerista edwardsae]